MVLITKSDYVFPNLFVKRCSFQLHRRVELCIITLRPAPRWTKWSRGVRTRGLRVGLVGGPRPLLFLGNASLLQFGLNSSPSTQSTVALTFRRTALIYGTDKPSDFVFERRLAAHHCGERVATVGFTDATLWHF